MAGSQPKPTATPTSGATPRVEVAGEGDLAPVTITTNVRHLHTMRYAMLRELKTLCEGAAESVHELSEVVCDFQGTRAYDTRSHVEWITEAVQALDDLGWARETEWKGYRA